MCLSSSRIPHQQHIFLPVDVLATHQLRHQHFVDRRLFFEVERIEGFVVWKLGSLESPIRGTLRQAYADAPGQATFVWNMGYAARGAAEEIEQLFQELFPEIAATSHSGRASAVVNRKP